MANVAENLVDGAINVAKMNYGMRIGGGDSDNIKNMVSSSSTSPYVVQNDSSSSTNLYVVQNDEECTAPKLSSDKGENLHKALKKYLDAKSCLDCAVKEYKLLNPNAALPVKLPPTFSLNSSPQLRNNSVIEKEVETTKSDFTNRKQIKSYKAKFKRAAFKMKLISKIPSTLHQLQSKKSYRTASRHGDGNRRGANVRNDIAKVDSSVQQSVLRMIENQKQSREKNEEKIPQSKHFLEENEDDEELNTARAAIYVLDAIHKRDSDHLITSMSDVKLYNAWQSNFIQTMLTFTAYAHFCLTTLEKPMHYPGGYLDNVPRLFTMVCELLFLTVYACDFSLRVYFKGGLKNIFSISKFKLVCIFVLILTFVDLLISIFNLMVIDTVTLRWSRIGRVVFFTMYIRRVKRYVQKFAYIARPLLPVILILLILMLFFGIVFISMFPPGCPAENLKCISIESNGTFASAFSILPKTISCAAYGPIERQQSSGWKEIPGAIFAQGHVYFRTFHQTMMELSFMLFGAVNYPDVQLPAMITMGAEYSLFFLAYLVVCQVLLLNILLATVFAAFENASMKQWVHGFTQYRVCLVKAFSSIDSDFSGTISFDEFKTLMNVVDENIQDDKISNLFHQMDTDGNETLGPGMY